MAKTEIFRWSTDQSNDLATRGQQRISFYHVPSGHSIAFKAFVTQFEDAYSSEWNSENVHGRMDPIQTFQHTGRQISLGFDVVAGSYPEAIENMERISLLLQMLYPSYEGEGGASTINASPYFKLDFMNLAADCSTRAMWSPGGNPKASGLLGTVGGFTYSPDLDVGVFQNSSDTSLNIYPKVVRLACTFTVIHQHKLGWNHAKPRNGFDKFPYLNNDLSDPEFVDQFNSFAVDIPESKHQPPKQESYTKRDLKSQLNAKAMTEPKSAKAKGKKKTKSMSAWQNQYRTEMLGRGEIDAMSAISTNEKAASDPAFQSWLSKKRK